MSRDFEKLDIWKRSCQIAVDTYKVLSACRDYGLKDQMTRSAVSIASNIAEGAERNSEKEFSRFLDIAKGSTGELRTQLYIAQELGVVDSESAKRLVEELKNICRMIQGLQNSYRRT